VQDVSRRLPIVLRCGLDQQALELVVLDLRLEEHSSVNQLVHHLTINIISPLRRFLLFFSAMLSSLTY
jgi:hypothetical protein